MNKPSYPSAQLRRNVLWNVFGLGFPLALAVLFIPRLISGMGTDRFGILTIILTFLNYFGFFDLGIGRALTQLLAGRSQDSQENEKEENILIWTVFTLLAILGMAAALILFLLAPFMVLKLLRIHGSLGNETVIAVRELAVALPFLIHSQALRGMLEAKRRFDLSNLIRIPVGIFTLGVPLLIIPFSHNLGVIVAIILSGRLIAWMLNFWMILRFFPHIRNVVGWEPKRIGSLMRFGGWFTVSVVVGPVIDSMDRFFISTFASISMVAYYTTPFELVNKLGIISGGIGGAIFPEFAFRLQRSQAEARTLFFRGFKYLMAILFPLVLTATAYAQEGLAWWLNPQFAVMSAPVLQWLAIFVFITGSAYVPLIFLQGAGRPDLAARMHLIELPLQAGLLYVFIKWGGIRGAAMACVIRITIDFIGMLFLSGTILGLRVRSYSKILLPMGTAIAVLFAFHIPMPTPVKASLFLTVISMHAMLSWIIILEKQDKMVIFRLLKIRHSNAIQEP